MPLLATLLAALLVPAPACADASDMEFLSVSTTSAWVRDEPRPTAEALWKVWQYAPVEAVSYREDWVKIRDYEGDEGWLPRAVLSETPTVCVTVPEGKIWSKPSAKSKVEWLLDKGYALRVFSSQNGWYEVSDLEDVSGWIKRGSVWGFPSPTRKPKQ